MEAKAVRLSGKIKMFSTQGGYGFLEPLSGGKDIFFHISNVVDNKILEKSDEVEYTLSSNDKGPRAIDIQVV